MNPFEYKEVWKQKFKLIFILIKLSEIQGAGRLNTLLPDQTLAKPENAL